MESKDSLNKIRFYYNNCAENSPTPTELKWFNTIEKDLDRLEKLDKVVLIIKKKKVNVGYLRFHFKKGNGGYTEYKRVMNLRYNDYYPSVGLLTQEEFDLLKEVFG